jgi:hypothetical protein
MTEILVCDSCEEEYEYDPQNRGHDRRTKCGTCRYREKRDRRVAELMEYAGGECVECGYDECWHALDFHHRNPEEKEMEMNRSNITKGWDRLISEADKCDLLCSNCHRERHCDGCGGCEVLG